MPIKRLQNTVSEGRFTLIFTCIYALIVTLPQTINIENMWIQLILLAVSTLLMMEFNNANALIRIYSRMVSCSFLALSVIDSTLLSSIKGGVFQLFFILFLLFLFRAYQDKKAHGYIYYAFLSLSISSLCFVQVLFIVPFLWILLFTNVLAGSIKNLSASILGLLTPYWLALGYSLYSNNIDPLFNHFSVLSQFEEPFNMALLSNNSLLILSFLSLLSLTGIIHFLRNSFLDKIKTRMIYEALIALNIIIFVFIVLQPQHYSYLIRLFIITVSPLIAHFVALTRTKITNIAFIVFSLITLIITIYSLWIHS